MYIVYCMLYVICCKFIINDFKSIGIDIKLCLSTIEVPEEYKNLLIEISIDLRKENGVKRSRKK